MYMTVISVCMYYIYTHTHTFIFHTVCSRSLCIYERGHQMQNSLLYNVCIWMCLCNVCTKPPYTGKNPL